MTARLAGLVLAGGRASRLGGGDKALLEVGGVPILARVLAALAQEAAVLAISANGDPSRFAAFGLPVLADRPETAGQGPLAGLLAGLEWATRLDADCLLTAPGDAPFLPTGLAAALAPPPAFAARGRRDHPLIALWPVGAGALLRRWLAEPGSRAVAALASHLGMRRVGFPAEGCDPFLNVNTPADLAEARRRAGSGCDR